MRTCAFESYPKGVTFNHKLSAVLNDVLEGKKGNLEGCLSGRLYFCENCRKSTFKLTAILMFGMFRHFHKRFRQCVTLFATSSIFVRSTSTFLP